MQRRQRCESRVKLPLRLGGSRSGQREAHSDFAGSLAISESTMTKLLGTLLPWR